VPAYEKPLPAVNSSDKEFWEAAHRHELRAYRCLNCGAYYSQVSDCLACSNPRMAWVKVSGRGRVFTFCVFHQLYHPAWKADLPYNVAWIKLEEGPLLLSNLVGCQNSEICVDMPVEVVYDDITPDLSLPKFKPVGKIERRE
jgi:uncharacterized OB-fold protein